MPRTRSLAWSELKLGMVGIAAIVLAATLIIAVGGQGGFFWQRYPLKVRFNDALGLKTGAVVRLSGKEIGAVTAVEFSGAQIEVTFEVSRDVRALITTDAIASIGSLSLLGEPTIEVRPATTGTALADWAYVRASQSRGALDEITTRASSGIDQASALIADVRAGRGSLGKLVTDDKLYADLDQFVASATAVTKAINDGKGTLGGLAKDPAAYNALKSSLENLQGITQKIRSGDSTLGRLVNDDAMGKSLAAMLTDLQQVTARMNRSDNTLGKLLTEKELYDQLTRLTGRIDTLVSSLNSGQGTAGQLLHDRALYENMNRAVTELRDLLADIRKDPKKYLRVSVSIF